MGNNYNFSIKGAIMAYLNNFIRCMDLNFCGNEDELNEYFDRIINYPGQQQYLGLKPEIKEILDNEKFDYINFLENDEYAIGLYGVKFPETQYEAKKFIIDYIWNKLYPDDKIEM